MKKYNIHNSEDLTKLVLECINLELKPHKTTVKKLLGKREQSFYLKYSFKTKKQYFAWLNNCYKLLRTKVTPKLSSHRCWKIVGELDLMYGLTCKNFKTSLSEIPYYKKLRPSKSRTLL